MNDEFFSDFEVTAIMQQAYLLANILPGFEFLEIDGGFRVALERDGISTSLLFSKRPYDHAAGYSNESFAYRVQVS